jgi:GAF domain-containing protein
MSAKNSGQARRRSSDRASMAQDFLCSDKGRDYLFTLAKASGFVLRAFSQEGEELYSTSAVHPLCHAVQASPGIRWRCDMLCRSYFPPELKTHDPKVFKCGAKVMNFLLPIEYQGGRAAVLGQGSFPGYDDLKSFTNDPNFFLLETAVLTFSPTFTSAVQARNVCHLLESYVNDLLRNSQETVSLHRRIESMRSVLEGWGSSTHMDPDAIYRHLVSNLSSFIEERALSVLVLDPQSGAFVGKDPLRGGVEGIAPASIGSQDPVVLQLSSGEQFVSVAGSPGDQQGGRRKEDSGYVVFPLPVNGRIESLLIMTGPTPAENDVQMILAFCRQAALAIENHRQHQDIYRKFDRLASVTMFSDLMTPGNNEQALLQTILEKSADLLLAEQGSLMLLDHETDALLMEATKGYAGEGMEQVRIPKGVGIAGKVAEFGEPMLVENIESDPRIGKKSSSRYKTSSFVSVPIKVDQRIMGVLNLADKTSGEVFNQEDLKLAQAFATHAGVILERNALSVQMEALDHRSPDRPAEPAISAGPPGRGNRPFPALWQAIERDDAGPRRFQAIQRHVRAPCRRPRFGGPRDRHHALLAVHRHRCPLRR